MAVQGFCYGPVAGEHVVTDCLYIHNCDAGVTFHDCSYLSMIRHSVAQHNTVIVLTTDADLFGMEKGSCNVETGTANFACGTGLKPEISQLQYGGRETVGCTAR